MANWAKLQEQLVGLPVAKRARHGIHFQKGANEFVGHFSGKPCHYLDNGLWKPIDTKLLAKGNGFYGSPHSDVKIHPDGRVVVDKSDYQQFTELPSAKAGKLSGDRIIRTFPGGEQHLIMKEDGFKEEIHVFKPAFPLEKFIAKTTGNLPSKYKAHPVTAEDADGNTYTFTGDVAAFGKWLDAAKYPVVIDPDFAGSTADKMATTYSATSWLTARNATPGSENTTSTTTDMGCQASWYDSRYLNLFDTSSIGAGGTVTQVNMKMRYNYGYSPTIEIAKFDWNGLTRAQWWAGLLTADADDSVWHTGAMSAGTTYTSGNLSTAWINKTGTTYYGIRTDYQRTGTDPLGNNYASICTANNATEAYRPVLTVTYTAGGSITPIVQYYNRLRRN